MLRRHREHSSRLAAQAAAVTVVMVTAAAVAIAAPAAIAPATTAAEERPLRVPASHSDVVLRLAPGDGRYRFGLRRPAGVVLLFRLTLPLGTRAHLIGRLGSVAGVGMTTGPSTCRKRGAQLVCEQGVEWCPLPRGTWSFVLSKRSGPAGSARLEFRVGTPPQK